MGNFRTLQVASAGGWQKQREKEDRQGAGLHGIVYVTMCSPEVWARSIQPKCPEISVQNSMDRFDPTGKVSKKRVHLLRWSSFPGRTGWNFGWMDRALFVFPFPTLAHHKHFLYVRPTNCSTREYHFGMAILRSKREWGNSFTETLVTHLPACRRLLFPLLQVTHKHKAKPQRQTSDGPPDLL